MARKKKAKKPNPKRERYAKFRKDKPAALDLTTPDLTDEQRKQKQIDEDRINKYLRFNRNPHTKEIVARKMKSKR